MASSYLHGKVVDRTMRALTVGATMLAIVPLASILVDVGRRGFARLDLAFFTTLPVPLGEHGGGLGQAVQGTLMMVGLACVMTIPVGVLGGVYLAEFGANHFGRFVRFSADVMTGVPSIVVGIFVYSLLVVTMHSFSGLAGAVALAILMLPMVVRTTEEMIKLVPYPLREAGLALGVPRWKVTLRIVLRTAAPSIATGVMMAVARVAGETAPLLFTALGSQFWAAGPDHPVASLPVAIYNYAGSPYKSWHDLAWTASLVLIGLVLIVNLAARFALRQRGPRR